MLRSLGGGQIKKRQNHGGGQSQSLKSKNFLEHSTEAILLRVTFSNICTKIIKI